MLWVFIVFQKVHPFEQLDQLKFKYRRLEYDVVRFKCVE
jgi:signal transduction histidine kinase